MKYGLTLSLIVLALAARLIPHPDNFTPMFAVALFGGAMLRGRVAYLVPLVAMFLSDLLMGFPVTWMTPVIYGCFAAGVGLGHWLGRSRTWARTGYVTVAGAVLFFLVTNFAVWIMPNGLYPLTFDGLVACFVMAVPFFRNEIAGDIFWVAALFGVYDFLQLWVPAQRSNKLAH